MTDELNEKPKRGRRATFKTWYAEKGEEHNDKRRALYKADPERRSAAQKRQADYRAKNPRVRLSQAGIKVVNGTAIKVFRIGEVCLLADISEQGLRKWEHDGLIPKPTVKGMQRTYTEHQVGLIQRVAKASKEVGFKGAVGKALREQLSVEIHKDWGGN